ncbi:conserved protein of unknown function (plasmid) [Rhodovastum atsumiense]|uniref:Uncharacterized protein n=1 Tax=Rhodovastum atsumiense TaxID=504468 RepID=A0A5M6ITF9_9PROT|nr:hypothetical protein [Rhodovastum atsumiense]KAA5611606.1 hypothetical protein F1189_13670 [Rhodovastum atsumiense]CAH2606309.1 conserved protein of unknown function [Rhodovastum atsumiense]
MRSRYTTEIVNNVICIEDTGDEHWDETRSVTDDLDNVIADLKERGFDLTLPIIYKDTETGLWDAVMVRDDRFDGFQRLCVESRSAAIFEVTRED